MIMIRYLKFAEKMKGKILTYGLKRLNIFAIQNREI
jgi:hypothetical protein